MVRPDIPPPLTLILYPGKSDKKLSVCLHSLPHENEGLFENMGLIPVSPWEIASVEQVAYALRYALMTPFLRNYPPQIMDWDFDITPPAWLKVEKDKVMILSPVTDHEVTRWFNPQREKIASDISDIKRKKEQEYKQHKNSGKHKQLKKECEDKTKKLKQWDNIKSEIEQAQAYFQHLLICPICQNDNIHNPNAFKPRDKTTFVCECTCNATWGLKLNKNKGYFLFLSPEQKNKKDDGKKDYGMDAFTSQIDF